MVVDTDLISKLETSAIQEKKQGRVRKSDHPVWDHPDLRITGWKFNEYDYFSESLALPCRARGLFTVGSQIVVRGYDKFFNIDEVRPTRWSEIEQATHAPYYATVKENGCLALISGYQGKLIVTSKHSSGPREAETSEQKNHSRVAKDWVLRHLASVEKTEAQLAQRLEEMDVTAVGELCDDAFEEHVLAYASEASGIYLTGLNSNRSEFVTAEPSQVQALGAEFGFRRTDFLRFDDLPTLRTFLDECAETGTWEDREIEGFVIRTTTTNGRAFFFKYKFEEPYLMYRQWREVTKQLLNQSTGEPARLTGKHRESSIRYLDFVKMYLSSHPALADEIRRDGKGIIELRQQFLASSDLSEKDLLKLSLTAPKNPKWVLVPVATIGCGKTTVGVALQKLFGWGHVQNDSLTGKHKAQELMRRTVSLLQTTDVVIQDRNNSERRERKQIFDDFPSHVAFSGYDVRFVALNFLPSGPTAQTKAQSRSRVRARGNNHQNIRNMPEMKILGIMGGFEGRFQPIIRTAPPDNQFDLIVDLSVAEKESSVRNVCRIIYALNEKYPELNLQYKHSDLDAAMKQAFDYKPEIRRSVNQEVVAKVPPMAPSSYFGIGVSPKDREKLLALLPAGLLHSTMELRDEFHVTVAHARGHKSRFKKLIKEYTKALLAADDGTNITRVIELPHTDEITITDLYYNSDVAALRVYLGKEESSNAQAHITIATAPGVDAVASNDLFVSDASPNIFTFESPEVVTGMLYLKRVAFRTDISDKNQGQ